MSQIRVGHATWKRLPVIEALLVRNHPRRRVRAENPAWFALRQTLLSPLWTSRSARVGMERRALHARSPERVSPAAESTITQPRHVFVQDGTACGVWVNERDGKPTLRLFLSDMC